MSFFIENIRKAINNKGTYREEGKEPTMCLHRQISLLIFPSTLMRGIPAAIL